MVPLGRGGHTGRHRRRLIVLCSDGGSYITGQVIGVNGGVYI